MSNPDGSEPGDDQRKVGAERRIPRSAWWIAGIAVAMVVVLVLARPSWFSQPPDQDDLAVHGARHFTKSFAALGDQDGVWLTNDVPSTVFTVPLPVDSGYSKPRLRLTGTSQVAQDSTVFLMVYIDGRQVYEEQLSRGTNRLNRTIDIPSQATEDGRVRVQIRTRGSLSEQHCTNEPSPGMVIHLDPTSVVEAALEYPISTVRDAVATLDHRVTMIVAATGPDWFATAAVIGMALTRAGHEVMYADTIPPDRPDSGSGTWLVVGPEAALSERLGWRPGDDDALDASIRVGNVDDEPALAIVKPEPTPIARFLTTSALVAGDGPSSDPVALATATSSRSTVGLAELGVDVSQTQIADSRSWTAPFSLADLPGGRLPESVRLGLQLPASPDDITWILNVSLNGELIASRRLKALLDTVELPLPAEAQRLNNELKITVQRDRVLGGCAVRVTDYPIQLLPESALTLGDNPGAGFTALPQKFAGGLSVDIAELSDSTALLNSVVPVLSTFIGQENYSALRWGTAAAPDGRFISIHSSAELSKAATPVDIIDGRLTAGRPTSLDLTTFGDGVLIQCAVGPDGQTGLSVAVKGDPGVTPMPPMGRECVQLVTPGGSFALSETGALVGDEPAETGSPQ